MTLENEGTSQETDSSIAVFLRGFFIRLLYGSFSLPVLFFIRPDFFGEKADALFFGGGFYLLVCVAGAIYDLATKQERRIRLWEKPRMIDVFFLVVILIGLILSK